MPRTVEFIASTLVTLGFVVSLSGCVVPSQPDWVAYAMAENACTFPIGVGVSNRSDDYDPSTVFGNVELQAEGTVKNLGVPIYLPEREWIFVWVVKARDEPMGTPVRFPVNEVPKIISSDGTIVYFVRIEGELCPN